METLKAFAVAYRWELVTCTVAAGFLVAAWVRQGLLRWTFLGIAGAALISAFVWGGEGGHAPWMWPFAALPAYLIVQHAVYLVMVRGQSPGLADRADRGSTVPEHLRGAWVGARDVNARYFSRPTIVVRYGGPAALAFVLCTTLVYRLHVHPLAELQEVRLAALYGFAGAYVYVLLYLGKRTFQHDITSGGATWCSVVLALGPVVAVVASRVLPVSSAADQGNLASAYAFAAGLSPKVIVSLIESVARRGAQALTGKQPRPTREVPIAQIRGITAEEEERLAEEGIHDVASLAMADPQRLLRNTPYDLRQIVSWIDEALLITTLPGHWEALERAGITGAIDLAWYHGNAQGPAALVNVAQVPPDVLTATARRLFEDAQVQRVWVLYQLGSSEIQSLAAAVA